MYKGEKIGWFEALIYRIFLLPVIDSNRQCVYHQSQNSFTFLPLRLDAIIRFPLKICQ